MIRFANSENSSATDTGLRQALGQRLTDYPDTPSHLLQAAMKDLGFAFAAIPLGLNEQFGELVVGSRRIGFPSKTERLLLNVAANQAAIGLQEARLRGELPRGEPASKHATTPELAELQKYYARLTRREREVLPFVIAGQLSKQTASDLGISEIAVRVHRGQIMRKMQAHSLAELIRMIDKLGIPVPPTS